MIAGLAVGIAFVLMIAILPIPDYPIFTGSFHRHPDADYTPLLKLQILDLKDSYMVGEGVDFAVRQTAGGGCVNPELIMIKDLGTGRIVREWNGTKEDVLLSCPIIFNSADFGVTWNTKGAEENPIVFNQTGSYAVVAKHLFRTVQKEFKIVAVGGGGDTSPDVSASLLSKSKDLDVVKALLERYPDANLTVTANYHSKLFSEFQKYHPNGIVQYSVSKTEPRTMTTAPAEFSKGDRALAVTVIFDRYYEWNNNSAPLIIAQCTGQDYSSLSISELYMPESEIEKC